ncbi:MAG: sulfur oxidation c-type cytochrome SoxA [Gammaproteobacteria bacterium]|nr:sulfur oxidation c-type cytochrome SoxA [Gammaproteobacteria bacterium]
MGRWLACLGLAAALVSGAARAADATEQALDEYRDMFGDENPAELWELRGQALWTEKRGPRQADLTACDLGLGPGVVAGAYAQLPRWFDDTGRVEDLEMRLVTCITRLQGYSEAEVLARRFGDGDKKSDLEALSVYIAKASSGQPVNIPLRHSAEQRAYALGEAAFFYRAGPHDFACATCHGDNGKRIRLQAMNKLSDAEGARRSYTQIPAYRTSQGEVRTIGWRLYDCFRQQRLPELRFGSEVAVGLSLYLARNAEGGVMAAPSIKR